MLFYILVFPVVVVRALTEYFPTIIINAIMMLSTFLVWSSDEVKKGKQRLNLVNTPKYSNLSIHACR